MAWPERDTFSRFSQFEFHRRFRSQPIRLTVSTYGAQESPGKTLAGDHGGLRPQAVDRLLSLI